MRILQVLELSTNEEAVATLPYGTEEVVLEGLLYVFSVRSVCIGFLHFITRLVMLSYYSWGNTPGSICLHGLLMCQLYLRLLPYEEKFKLTVSYFSRASGTQNLR